MRKQYKRKKGSGCALCKPHKHGWANRWTAKDRRADPQHDKIEV